MLLPDWAFLDSVIQWMGHGLFDFSWWQMVFITLGLTHITIASVTIFLHRHQAHRALDLHAIPSHFFRFWLWLTTGQVTKEWAAIHRKHHAKCEQAEDPHSPHVHGIKTVLFTGAELYRKESKNLETMKRFGHNDLQPPAMAYSSEVTQALEIMQRRFGNARMTGSGSAVFSWVEPDSANDTALPSVSSLDVGKCDPSWAGRLCHLQSAKRKIFATD